MIPVHAPGSRCLPVLMLVGLMLFSLQTHLGAETTPANDQLQVTAEMLTSKIDALSQNSGVDETSKAKLLDLYHKGLDNLSAIEANNAQAN
ncbi:MAG: hypothetical protein AB7E77_06955, partial [Desulfobulbus sp.]